MELNEFPKQIVKNAIKQTLNEKEQNNVKEENENMIKMFLPFEKGISEAISRMSKRFNVKVIHTKSRSLNSLVKPARKNEKEKETEQGVVYKVKCKDCGKLYIGETGRMLKLRLKEHKYGAKKKEDQENVSGLSQHMQTTKHEIDFDNAEILYKEGNYAIRKMKEGIAIKRHQYEKHQLMNKKEEIKSLSEVWEGLL